MPSDETTILDATGLKCPLPVLRARKVLKSVAPGGRLDVLATDRAAPADFEAFCRETGHRLLGIDVETGRGTDDEVFRIRIGKAG